MAQVILQENIRKVLSDRSMSVSELERRCGLKHSAIQNILHGRSKSPSIGLIQSIAEGLDCSIEELIGDGIKQSSQTKDTSAFEWDANLFIRCIETLQKISENKGITFTFEQAITLTTEIYNYTKGSKMMNVDKRFVEWFIERFHK